MYYRKNLLYKSSVSNAFKTKSFFLKKIDFYFMFAKVTRLLEY